MVPFSLPKFTESTSNYRQRKKPVSASRYSLWDTAELLCQQLSGRLRESFKPPLKQKRVRSRNQHHGKRESHPQQPGLGAWSWADRRHLQGGRRARRGLQGDGAHGKARWQRGFTGVSVPAGPALGAKTSRGKEATKRPGQGGESQLSSVIKANKT